MHLAQTCYKKERYGILETMRVEFLGNVHVVNLVLRSIVWWLPWSFMHFACVRKLLLPTTGLFIPHISANISPLSFISPECMLIDNFFISYVNAVWSHFRIEISNQDVHVISFRLRQECVECVFSFLRSVVGMDVALYHVHKYYFHCLEFGVYYCGGIAR